MEFDNGSFGNNSYILKHSKVFFWETTLNPDNVNNLMNFAPNSTNRSQKRASSISFDHLGTKSKEKSGCWLRHELRDQQTHSPVFANRNPIQFSFNFEKKINTILFSLVFWGCESWQPAPREVSKQSFYNSGFVKAQQQGCNLWSLE